MHRAAKIATGISVLVIASLVAVAAPVVTTAAGTLSEWAVFRPAAEAVPSDAPETEEVVDLERSAAVVGTEEDALISAGDGTSFSAEGPGDCTTNAAIHPYGAHDPRARLGGELTDMGATAVASGEVGFTADGLIESYTVAPGDTLVAIGERFCVDYITVGGYNDRLGSIQPGDVLILRP